MKKLRLRALDLGAREILSREQLKSITGGCTHDEQCNGGICNPFSECIGGSGSGYNGSSGEGSVPNEICFTQAISNDPECPGQLKCKPQAWSHDLNRCEDDPHYTGYCATSC